MFVTGGRGRMGQELVPRLAALGWMVVAPSSLETNILEFAQLERALEPGFDVVLHLAAYTDVARAERERDACWALNVTGTRNVARASSRIGARLVHFSSDYVFDGERGMYTEGDAPNPSNYYSLTKVVAEEAARGAFQPVIVRTSFKDAVWKYPVAFSDQFTSADYTDVIAQRRNPHVSAGSRVGANVHIPPDISLDVSRWTALKAGFGRIEE
jgi:dTDP-4-dehydrorhamnose reductase